MSKADALKLAKLTKDDLERNTMIGEVEEGYALIENGDPHFLAGQYLTWRGSSDDDYDYYPSCVYRQIAVDAMERAKELGYKFRIGKRLMVGVPYADVDRPEGVPEHAELYTFDAGYSHTTAYKVAVYTWKEDAMAEKEKVNA